MSTYIVFGDNTYYPTAGSDSICCITSSIGDIIKEDIYKKYDTYELYDVYNRASVLCIWETGTDGSTPYEVFMDKIESMII